MQKHLRIAAVAAAVTLMSLPASVVLAQGTTDTGAAPAAAPAAPAATTPAPAATTAAPAATTAPATTTEKAAEPKKKKTRTSRQQEIDRSIDNGTVPARYRKQVPKEYQQYVPFDKR